MTRPCHPPTPGCGGASDVTQSTGSWREPKPCAETRTNRPGSSALGEDLSWTCGVCRTGCSVSPSAASRPGADVRAREKLPEWMLLVGVCFALQNRTREGSPCCVSKPPHLPVHPGPWSPWGPGQACPDPRQPFRTVLEFREKLGGRWPFTSDAHENHPIGSHCLAYTLDPSGLGSKCAW